MKTIITRTLVGFLLLTVMPLSFMIIQQLVTGEFVSSFYRQLSSAGLILFALLMIKKLSANIKQPSEE